MFHPNMHSIVEGFSASAGPSWRSWTGMLADVWEVEGASGARGEYISPHPRLFIVLDETAAGSIHLGESLDRSCGAGGRISYIPAGLRIWSSVTQPVKLQHLDLHLDLRHFRSRLNMRIDEQLLQTPRLMFDNDKIMGLAHLLAAECKGPRLHDLYSESLATAIFIELFSIRAPLQDRRGQLSPRLLRMATQYLEENCNTSVRLQVLADLVGLSPSYFSSAFKATTGNTPLQWQMRARIARVKLLLQSRSGTLSEIADVTGFADQAHMTRVFKQYVGDTPAAWLRAGMSNV